MANHAVQAGRRPTKKCLGVPLVWTSWLAFLLLVCAFASALLFQVWQFLLVVVVAAARAAVVDGRFVRGWVEKSIAEDQAGVVVRQPAAGSIVGAPKAKLTIPTCLLRQKWVKAVVKDPFEDWGELSRCLLS